jgi:glycosyltransferase involved in cell wall biosynthesis
VAGRIWIDVEDLFVYSRSVRRPTGIQRVVFELARAMVEDLHVDVRFLRHDRPRSTFRVVPMTAVRALFAELTGASPPGASKLPARRTVERLLPPGSPVSTRLRRLSYRIPVELRQPLIRAVGSQLEAISALLGAFRTIPGLLARAVRRRGTEADRAPAGEDFPDLVSAGDTILVLGAPWSHAEYAALIDAARARYGIRFALLVHDVIPGRRPEWTDRRLALEFRPWFSSMLPRCDRLFAMSQATAADVTDWAASNGVALGAPAQTIPVGNRLGPTQMSAPAQGRRLPEPGSYVLFVSTIEARKNHALLVRVWRTLLDEWDAGRVPVLVFAGRIGWLVDDLMRQLVNSGWLDGKVMVIEGPDDGELAALYRGCLFTVFPSFYEGWGLPVTESMAFGKPCVASNATSLPEAGGDLARYFDPENLGDAVAVIRGVLADPEGLAAWTAQVRAEFRPVGWEVTARSIAEALDAMPRDAGGGGSAGGADGAAITGGADGAAITGGADGAATGGGADGAATAGCAA